VRRLDHVFLQVGLDAVLRSEDRADRDAGVFRPLNHMPEVRVDRRGIADDADGAAFEELAVEQDVGAKLHCGNYLTMKT